MQRVIEAQLAKDGQARSKQVVRGLRRYWFLYVLFIPVILYYAVLRYYPIVLQVVLAFKDYKLSLGVWDSPWVGFHHFEHIFGKPEFYSVLENTIAISLLRIVFGFFPPIILAILLFDLRSLWIRKVSQTILYIPHFFSWVIIYGIVFAIFSNSGFVNQIIEKFGGEAQNFLMASEWFRPLIVGSGIWKEIGWGTIIYLAALTSINPSIYEAAKIDGAGPLQRIWHITLPGMKSVIVFLFTLSLGSVLNAGVEQILLFYSPATYEVGDIIDTYVYRQGLNGLQYSMATAVGLFQSAIGLILILTANHLAKKYAGTGIW
ncbi:ABC transporter permease subunit [Paenibacillus sp. J5C_2022]|uniref:ABC transporter permease n=1 Tax=Paenibacillus sp. J5C2022 TaxID=2977129 RepID=UPI0021CF2CA9|nr:ABC transporter permease subunit [Paenibacillus sp. J5C2022]MCU6711979.1 ABC transporter permease subunit [Paenibacillus sp. J5C2022]